MFVLLTVVHIRIMQKICISFKKINYGRGWGKEAICLCCLLSLVTGNSVQNKEGLRVKRGNNLLLELLVVTKSTN